MDYRIIAAKLEGEYFRVFEEVEAYTMVKHSGGGEESDELMMDLLDLLLTAQEEGKEPEKIIGSDVKKFCEEYFSVYDKKADRIERLLRELMWFAGLGVLNCILDLFDNDMNFAGFTAGLKTNWTVMLCCIGVGFLVSVVLDIVFHIMYRHKPLQSGKLSNIILFASVIGAALGIFIANRCHVVVMLPFVPAFVTCIVVILFCFACNRVRNYRKYGSVWKPKEKKEKGKLLYIDDTADGVSTPYEKEMFQGLLERYEKKNAKRQKKNEAALTPEEFMVFLEQENERLRKDSRRMPVIWGIIAVITTGIMAMLGGFSSILDGCIFFIILAGIMSIIYYFVFGKFVYGKVLSDRVRLLAKCRKNGKTVLDYVEREKKIK